MKCDSTLTALPLHPPNPYPYDSSPSLPAVSSPSVLTAGRRPSVCGCPGGQAGHAAPPDGGYRGDVDRGHARTPDPGTPRASSPATHG